jgi:glycosyltransferase involved in cell wall biosynthesis
MRYRVLNVITDHNYRDRKFDSLKFGNPGIGGTLYSQLLTSLYLHEICSLDILSINFSNCTYEDIKMINYYDYESWEKIIEKYSISSIIIDQSPSLLHEVNKAFKKLNVIMIANVHLSKQDYAKISESSNLRVVFQGKETYLHYLDTPIFDKMGVISPFLPVYNYRVNYKITDNLNSFLNKFNITYIGSITKTKGFHLLAKNIKRIKKSIPNAHFHVIGSGKLYGDNLFLGKYNIAEDKYEKSFIKYLLDDNSKLLDYVTFHGVLGREKEQLIRITNIGIVNPIAKSETFCLSAIDFTANGVPIVTMRRFGLVDTVRNTINGLTYRFSFQLSNRLIALYRDNALYKSIQSQCSSNTVEAWFSSSIALEGWEELIVNSKFKNNFLDFSPYFVNKKLLRIMNKRIGNLIGILIPIVYYEYFYGYTKSLIKKFLPLG